MIGSERGDMEKNLKTYLHKMAEMAADVCFPRRCPVCGKVIEYSGQLICPECVTSLSPVRQPACQKCGKEVEGERMEYCFDCGRHPKTFERCFSLLNYNEAARRSMAAIKYQNRREYLDFYGEALCLRFGNVIKSLHPDGLVPVPVHPSRKRIRGFNQAEVLSRRISAGLEIPVYPDMLKRIKKTMPQKELNPSERFHNLEHAFGPGGSYGRMNTVILVDDIYTTGSTLEACARVLKMMGVKKVYGVVLCVGAGN